MVCVRRKSALAIARHVSRLHETNKAVSLPYADTLMTAWKILLPTNSSQTGPLSVGVVSDFDTTQEEAYTVKINRLLNVTSC